MSENTKVTRTRVIGVPQVTRKKSSGALGIGAAREQTEVKIRKEGVHSYLSRGIDKPLTNAAVRGLHHPVLRGAPGKMKERGSRTGGFRSFQDVTPVSKNCSREDAGESQPSKRNGKKFGRALP